jgi:hypothetical protein
MPPLKATMGTGVPALDACVGIASPRASRTTAMAAHPKSINSPATDRIIFAL